MFSNDLCVHIWPHHRFTSPGEPQVHLGVKVRSTGRWGHRSPGMEGHDVGVIYPASYKQRKKHIDK